MLLFAVKERGTDINKWQSVGVGVYIVHGGGVGVYIVHGGGVGVYIVHGGGVGVYIVHGGGVGVYIVHGGGVNIRETRVSRHLHMYWYVCTSPCKTYSPQSVGH